MHVAVLVQYTIIEQTIIIFAIDKIIITDCVQNNLIKLTLITAIL